MKKIIKNLFCFSLILLFLSSCSSKNITIQKTETIENVETGETTEIIEKTQTIEKPEIIKKSEISNEHVGYIVVDKKTGEILDQQNINQSFIPASSTKIITAYSALEVLGKNYRFQTTIKLDQNWQQKIKNNVYEGNLYLEGDFDPTLTVPDLINLVVQLKKAGINEIKGNFLYKISAIDDITKINQLQPSSSYNSAVGTLNIARPDSFRNAVRVNDVMDLKSSSYLPIKNPTLYVAQLFRNLCLMHGILLPSPKSYISKTTTLNSEIFSIHESSDLIEIVQLMLNQSINETAELLALKTAQKIALNKKISSIADAQEIITNWLKLKIHANFEGYYSQNGSGLSSSSRITPNQFINILNEAFSIDLGDKSFIALLPISGWSGTLNSRLSDSQANMRIYAKTGTVNYGNALVGSLFTNKNRELLFVILISDINQKNVLDSKNKISKSDAENASLWSKKARILQDKMVKKWIEELKY